VASGADVRRFRAIPALAGIVTDSELETHPPIAHLDDIKRSAIAALIHAPTVNIEDMLAQSHS
jgi:hypothetical protein